MFAVVKIGSTQFKVAEGDLLEIDRLHKDIGETVTLDKVILLSDGKEIRIGQPHLDNVKVTAKVVNHPSGKKVFSFKYRKRKDSSTKKGSRRKLTVLSITKISTK